MRRKTGFALATFLAVGWAQAAEVSNQPYIDRLKKGLEAKPEGPGSYTESEKKKLGGGEGGSGEGYTEKLKKGLSEQKKEEGTFIEREKAKLKPAPEGEQSAIAKFKAGKSDLEARRSGDIHHAYGVRIGVSTTRDITTVAGASLRPFADVYGTNWAPDATLFYEFQPFHSEWFGNVGVMLSGGMSYFRGKGTFQYPLYNQAASQPFSAESQTKLSFFIVPLNVGLNYRFNLLRILRPYVAAGPNVIGYMEARSDSKSGNRGFSTGLWMGGGVAVLLDWVSDKSTWDLYAEHGIKHFYLTLDYWKQTTLNGDVKFGNSGVYSGFTFEY